METLNLVQGSKEWNDERAKHFTASEAPAMSGKSKYQSRDQLLTVKKTGIQPEIDAATQKIFNLGHQYEALARPFAETIIGNDLYPVTGSDVVDEIHLLASFDGMTMTGDTIWEHKTANATNSVDIANGVVDEMYAIQMEQQLMISGASKCLFMASKGTEDTMVHCWYESDPKLRADIIAGWKQFAIDLEAHEHIEEDVKPVAAVIESLPALMVELAGEVKNTNIAVYEKSTIAFIQGINSELSTDEDFANAEQNVKFCADAEKQLAAAKQHALSQTADIDKLFSTIDRISEELRSKRLMLDKLVKSQKAAIKAEIVNKGSYDLQAHVDSLNESLEESYINIGDLGANFPAVIKGKRTMTSIRGAVNDELAKCKILANEIAETMRANLKLLSDNNDYRFLFNDLESIVIKDSADFKLLAESRINEHKEKLAEKERVRIADEEAEKTRIAEEAAKTEEKADEAVPVKEEPIAEAQDIGGEPDEEQSEATQELSEADAKKRQADINKLKKYVARLNDYKVPALENAQCIGICAKITEQLMTYQDRLNKLFPEAE